MNRLKNIKVYEISLVDKPANQEKFLIIKRQEDDKMSEEKIEK